MLVAITVVLAVIGSQYHTVTECSTPIPVKGGRFHIRPRTTKDPSTSTDQADICLTPGCVGAAAQILDSLDMTTDPCVNFYQFACGGWIEKQNLPEEKTRISQYTLLQDNLDHQVRQLIETPVDEAHDPPFIVKLKNFYQSCLNTSYIEKLGEQPLKDILQDVGGWPVVEEDRWNESAFDWVETLAKMWELGFTEGIFFDIYVYDDPKNNTKYIIHIDKPSFGLRNPYNLRNGIEDPIVKAYFKLMTRAVTFLGAKLEPMTRRELEECLQFETLLAEITDTDEPIGNISAEYHQMTLRELEALAPSIAWQTLLNKLFNSSIPSDEPIEVASLKYLKRFGKLLELTNKRTLANHMIWRLVLQSFDVLGKNWADAVFEYRNIVAGKRARSSRWKECYDVASRSMSLALSNLYVQEYYQESTEFRALDMARYTFNELLETLEEVKWLDPKTRERAKEKARHLGIYTGYPDEWLNNTVMNEFHKNLIIHPDQYFSNTRLSNKWINDIILSLRKGNHIKGDWRFRSLAALANAYYIASENIIEIPVGVLQGVFFSPDRPNYLTFGSIGSIIGHEITHAFDNKGRQYDKDGNNNNWWEPETNKRFNEEAECMIHQYANYTLPGTELRINGIKTLGENIADNGGIKHAFRAYLQWERDHGPEGTLPGLNYTAHQLFWISNAISKCEKVRPETVNYLLLYSDHSPEEFRVRGPFSNSEEFAVEFKCPLGSPMNPEKKCSIW